MPSDRTLAPPVGASKRSRRKIPRIASLAVVTGVSLLLFPASTFAAAPVGLGTADSFAVLAGSGITNTGPTTITGDVGTFSITSETGFGSVTLNGTDHAGDAVTQQAKSDLTTAYGVAAGSGPPNAVATELGGLTLTPGVYNGGALAITGTLTLDTQGDPAAVFIFQASSTLVTASNSAVVVLNGGTACNVFWQVASSVTLGTGSHLIGSVLALTSISATTGATIDGRLLARNGAVTLDTNTITAQTCPASTTTTTAAPGATTTIAGAGGGGSTVTTNGSTTATGTGTGGPTTSTSTPDTVPPGLARTGFEGQMALAGGFLIASGVLMECASRVRRLRRLRPTC